MDIGLTTMSSKGQIVVPASMRADIKEGDKLIVFRSGDRLFLKKASSLDKKLVEDLEFARRTEEAWQEVQKGNKISMSKEDFLKKLDKWSK